MNTRFLLYGTIVALLWSAENASSVLLTTTVMTGLVGGYLIGRMTLGTFLGLLSNNGTAYQLPQLPPLPQISSVNFSSLLPSFPRLIPAGEEKQGDNKIGTNISESITSTTTTTTTTAIPIIQTTTTRSYTYSPSNIPYVYTYNYPVPYPYPIQTYYTQPTTVKPIVRPTIQLSMSPAIQPVDVPLSLDNKVRDRFIRQLAIMDPLNCLPKIFCEVSSDPYAATFLMNYGTISDVETMGRPSITKEEMAAYEYHLQRQQQRPRPTRPTTTTTTTPRPTFTTTTTSSSTSAASQNDDEDQSASDEEENEDDDISASAENYSVSDEDDDSFEQYRKEQEHKIEMQALEEMVDEIEDPETYMLILRDKQRRKAARKRYREKHRKKESLLSPNEEPSLASFRQEGILEEQISPLDFSQNIPDYEESASFLNRRMSVNFPSQPPSMEPPRFLPKIRIRLRPRTTPGPLDDMFSDDPFFDDFPSKSSGRSRRAVKIKRTMRQLYSRKEDLMKKYKLAYMVAEKFQNPEICSTAFPSCPYRAETILSVVNRMESGIVPFQLSSDKKTYFSNNNNNIDHFKNTLQAIERLNKATLAARARGEPIDIEEIAKIASSPVSNIDASTSKDIVNEFQHVVTKIKTKKLKKKKNNKQRKHKKNKNQAKYDAVHYYKKAQMDILEPKGKAKTGVKKEPARLQDDELQMHKQWDKVPSFKQTYNEMFKTSKRKNRRPELNTDSRRKGDSSGQLAVAPTSQTFANTKAKPIRKFSESNEDDEKDAKESEEAIDALIVHGRRHRSLFT